MKKSIALLALAFGVTGAYAQDLTSKKGEPILPEADDWAIGVDATPFLDYAGNFFGKTAKNNAPTWNNYSLNQSITGKYFKDATMAYRVTVRLGMMNQKNKKDVSTFAAPATGDVAALTKDPDPKFDTRRASTRNIVVGVGIEKRKGKTRLQGFYGADLLVWGGNTKETFKYGNALTQTDDATTAFNENLDANGPSAYTTDWNTVDPTYSSNVATSITGYSQVDAARALKRKTNGKIGVGVRAFIGAEYFIFPKISIGGEFGWGIGYQLNTKDKATWDAEGTGTAAGSTQTAGTIKTKDVVNGGGQFVIDTDRNALNDVSYNLMGGTGTIRLNFHF